MLAPSDSIPVKILKRLALGVYYWRVWFIYPQVLLFGLCVWYTITRLDFDMSRNNLVGSDKKYHQIYLKFKTDFNVRDDFVVVVESEDPEKNRQFVERLGARMEAQTNLFGDVFYKGDLKMLGPKALLFLDEPTLRELQKTLREYRPFIASFAQATNLNSLFGLVNRQFRGARRQQNAETDSLLKAIPALERVIDLGTDSMRRFGTPPSPGITALFGSNNEAQEEQYITFAKGRIFLVNARTVRDDQGGEGVEKLRELVRQTYDEVPGVNAGLTGEPVLEYDEMLQSQRDSTVATIVSLVLCAIIFIVSYRETGRPLKATAALIIGLGYTMGFTTLVVGHLNILTVTFLPILIGLAIDFGVHLITRYEEELRNGETQYTALQLAMVNTGLGIFTGCLTTAGAFFAMTFTSFKGIQEMGVITGSGMLLSLIPMMTVLPAMMLRGKQNKMDQEKPAHRSVRARLERTWLDRPITVVAIVVTGTLLALIPLRRVHFDYNLLHMQSSGLPAVEFEQKLIDSASKSVLYAAVVANSKEEALLLETKLTNLPTVASVDSMAKYLVGDQSPKLKLIDQIKAEAATLHFARIDSEPVDVSELSRTLWSLHGYLGLALAEVEKENVAELAQSLGSLRRSIENFRHEMLNSDRRLAGQRLGAYQRALFADLQETFRALRTQDTSSPLTEAGLPPNLRSRFIGNNGLHLLQVYPKYDVWQRKEQEDFVREVRSVVPDATGTPVQLLEYTTLLKNSYIEAAYYSLGAIIVLVFIHFRRLSAVFLALVPVAIGTLWTCGLMGLLNVPFNPANIMTLPLVVGIGVTNGIHILNRFAEEQNPGILARSTGKAVIVSALTTIAGFGSLIPAKHQGIQSLGIVMSIGVAMCMLAAVTFLPAILTLMMRFRGRKKKPSGDNAQSTLGREEPRLKPHSR
ncbi:MAG TPA: MMPL family transporter [Verrucomicrobiae bacterium]|nr:MMPL family transporter [Verrucomicrobiae bacterium]